MAKSILFYLLFPLLAAAQAVPPIATLVSSTDGTAQPYALFLPRDFNPQTIYPLILSLHSEESNHRLNLTQVLGAAGPTIQLGQTLRPQPLRDAGFIVACPLARGSMGYQGIPEQDVYDVLADVERRYPIDRDRVYLTGISMGGGGALWLAATRPDIWAGVAALCPDPMPGSDELAGNLLNVPLRLYQGELDTVVPPASSRNWQRRLLDLGVPVSYTEYPATRHNVWDLAYYRGGVLEWFAGLRRNPSPDRVRFTTSTYQYTSAYWLRIDGLTPGLPATLDARRSPDGSLQVIAKNVDGFTLTAPPATDINIDGVVLKLKRGAPLSFNKTPAGWRQGLTVPAGKHAGAEGPILRAVSGRHIYVYGTVGAQTPEELAERRKVAQEAANWSTTRSRLQLTLPVKADREISADDLDTSDLVLFGTAESNALIARFADGLPMALRPDAADYGLLFIAPIGKHYALVNSGLPFWTRADESHAPGYSGAPIQFRELSALGDYLLFRGSATQVVAQGRFDANWKLPSDAPARKTAAGTITIQP